MSAAVSTLNAFRDLDRGAERESRYIKKCWAAICTEHRPSKVTPEKERKDHARKIERASEHRYFSWLSAGPESQIDRLMARSRVIVAVPHNEPRLVSGFIAFEADCLHVIYCGSIFRRMGIARALMGRLPSGLRSYSQWTPAIDHVVTPEWHWDPHMLYRGQA